MQSQFMALAALAVVSTWAEASEPPRRYAIRCAVFAAAADGKRGDELFGIEKDRPRIITTAGRKAEWGRSSVCIFPDDEGLAGFVEWGQMVQAQVDPVKDDKLRLEILVESWGTKEKNLTHRHSTRDWKIVKPGALIRFPLSDNEVAEVMVVELAGNDRRPLSLAVVAPLVYELELHLARMWQPILQLEPWRTLLQLSGFLKFI